jgi:hypothetical protein
MCLDHGALDPPIADFLLQRTDDLDDIIIVIVSWRGRFR